MRFFNHFLSNALAVVLAAALCQFPVYFNQYLNVLSGATTESTKVYQDIQKAAAQSNKTVEAFIAKHLGDSDLDFKNSGKVMDNAVKRYEGYKIAFEALESADFWSKPFRFVKYWDKDLAQAVKFQAGIPANTEGLAYALLGVLVSVILTFAVEKIIRPKRDLAKY